MCVHSDHLEPFHPGRLISPCQCRGSSAWVHRGCLDQWRATQEERAFSQCTECNFVYTYVEKNKEDVMKEVQGLSLSPSLTLSRCLCRSV